MMRRSVILAVLLCAACGAFPTGAPVPDFTVPRPTSMPPVATPSATPNMVLLSGPTAATSSVLPAPSPPPAAPAAVQAVAARAHLRVITLSTGVQGRVLIPAQPAGTAYVLLHGHAAPAANMDPLAWRLAADRSASISIAWHPVGITLALGDIRAGIAVARTLAPRVVLVGFSMGGYLAVLAAHSTAVDEVVGIEGAYELRDARVGPLLKGLLGAAYADPAYDVLRLGPLPVPLTIISLTNDDEVYPYTARALAAVCHVPVRWIPGTFHPAPIDPTSTPGKAALAILESLR
ncbi:MAG: alpha/beta hydrolase [Candidatus Limnocylindrales bacterium]